MFWEVHSEKKVNPVSRFFDWKSDKENKTGTFKSRDKETKEEFLAWNGINKLRVHKVLPIKLSASSTRIRLNASVGLSIQNSGAANM